MGDEWLVRGPGYLSELGGGERAAVCGGHGVVLCEGGGKAGWEGRIGWWCRGLAWGGGEYVCDSGTSYGSKRMSRAVRMGLMCVFLFVDFSVASLQPRRVLRSLRLRVRMGSLRFRSGWALVIRSTTGTLPSGAKGC